MMVNASKRQSWVSKTEGLLGLVVGGFGQEEGQT